MNDDRCNVKKETISRGVENVHRHWGHFSLRKRFDTNRTKPTTCSRVFKSLSQEYGRISSRIFKCFVKCLPESQTLELLKRRLSVREIAISLIIILGFVFRNNEPEPTPPSQTPTKANQNTPQPNLSDSNGPGRPKETVDDDPRQGLRFTEHGDHVSISGPLIHGNEPITIEVIITPEDVDKNCEFINLYSTLHLALVDGSPDLSGISDAAGTQYHIWASHSFEAGRPANIAAVYDGSTFKFFGDGRRIYNDVMKIAEGRSQIANQDKFKLHSRYKELPNSWTIGTHPKSSLSFLGTFHELRVSKVARFDQDYAPVSSFLNDSATLALYHFNEGEGYTLNDSSGSNLHGTIFGAEWSKTVGTEIDAP